MNKALQHEENLRSRTLEDDVLKHYAALAATSVERQKEIEAADSMSFDDYLADIAASYQPLT